MSSYVFHFQHNTEKCNNADVWNSLHSSHAPSWLLLSPAERKLTSATWRKDPSGAVELHRRLLDNHGYLTVSGPISLSLSICFPQSLTLQSSAGLARTTKQSCFLNSHRAGTVRMRSVRLGSLWLKDGEEEEDGAPLNWSL